MMHIMSQQYKKLQKDFLILKFFIFSDDKTAAKKFIEKYSNLNMCLVDYTAINSTIEDLYLMKSCKHFQLSQILHIVGGVVMLNHNTNKIVVAPDGKNDLNRNKLYPTSWTVLITSERIR